MASDFARRLQLLLEDLPKGYLPSVSALSAVFHVTEAEVHEALLESGRSPMASSPAFEQTVHGTANSQVGQGNAQYNIHGPLLSLTGATEALPTLDVLRKLMAEPPALYDILERRLAAERSRRVLSLVLSVSTEHPEWETLFEGWIRQTPILHGQPWFVLPTVNHYSEELTSEAAAHRHDLFQLLFGGLLDAGQEDEAVLAFMSFMTHLEQVTQWEDSHWNILNGVIKTFWCSDLGEVRSYPSKRRQEEAQFHVVMTLRRAARHFRENLRTNDMNQLLTALAYFLYDVASDEVLSLVDHCTRDEWPGEVLELQTVWELLNALDHARQPSLWWEEEPVHEQRLIRHDYADLVARQILKHVEKQIGRSDYFCELVSRAGMREADNGDWVSRYTLAVKKRHL